MGPPFHATTPGRWRLAIAAAALHASFCWAVTPGTAADAPALTLQLAIAEVARHGNDEIAERNALLAAAALLRQSGSDTVLLITVLERAEQLYRGGIPNASDEAIAGALVLREELLRLHRQRDPAALAVIGRDCFAISYYIRRLRGAAAAQPAHRCYLDAEVARSGQASRDGYQALASYADLLHGAGNIEEAERLYRTAIAGFAKLGTVVDTERGLAMSHYASMLAGLARYSEFEDWLQQALAVLARSSGETSEHYLGVLGALTTFYFEWGRRDEAERLVWRAFVALDKKEPHGFLLALYAWRAGAAALRAGQPDEAAELFQRSLVLHERIMGPRYLHLGSLRLDMAEAEEHSGRLEKARELRLEARRFFAAIGQSRSLRAAQAALALGEAELRAGREGAAQPLLQEAFDIASHIPDSAGTEISAGFALMRMQARQQRNAEAARTASLLLPAVARRIRAASSLRIDAEAVQKSYRPVLAAYLAVQAGRMTDPEGAWQAVQLANINATSLAIVQMANRAGSGDARLGEMLRDQNELVRSLRSLDAAAADATVEGASGIEEKRRVEEARIRELRAAIARDYPRFGSFATEEALDLESSRLLLREREALVVFHFAPDAGYVWVIKRHAKPSFTRLPIGAAELAQRVAALRHGLEIDNGGLIEFDLATAHRLYRDLFGQVAAGLSDIDHLSVVPDGALMALPLEVLATTGTGAQVTGQDYSRVPWLARRYSVSILPSVAALHGLRAIPPDKSAMRQKPFVGLGDPLAGPGSRPESATRFPRLPSAAKELRQIAKLLSALPDDVLVGADASEARFRTLDLTRYRVLAFATHGLKSGELAGLREPALLLASGNSASTADDGLLTASEISSLRIAADWVILSACNTAGPDGSGGEALSGLARAFFYAGARAAFATHWYVETNAAALLTTAMFESYSANRDESKANAHRAAILSMIDRPATSHPALWGAYSLIGDGLTR